MSDATGPRAVASKPKRENFKTDDDFGEAYVLWRSQQILAAVAPPSAPPPKPKPVVARAPAPAPVALPPAAALPRRSEAEREAWNLSTKARFWRAKVSASKNKGE